MGHTSFLDYHLWGTEPYLTTLIELGSVSCKYKFSK